MNRDISWYSVVTPVRPSGFTRPHPKFKRPYTDAEREWAYDWTSHIGQLARGLDEAPKRGWILADMKQDWKVVYSFQK